MTARLNYSSSMFWLLASLVSLILAKNSTLRHEEIVKYGQVYWKLLISQQKSGMEKIIQIKAQHSMFAFGSAENRKNLHAEVYVEVICNTIVFLQR